MNLQGCLGQRSSYPDTCGEQTSCGDLFLGESVSFSTMRKGGASGTWKCVRKRMAELEGKGRPSGSCAGRGKGNQLAVGLKAG